MQDILDAPEPEEQNEVTFYRQAIRYLRWSATSLTGVFILYFLLRLFIDNELAVILVSAGFLILGGYGLIAWVIAVVCLFNSFAKEAAEDGKMITAFLAVLQGGLFAWAMWGLLRPLYF